MAERLRRVKEEPLLDDRIPHPYREIVKELKEIQSKLDEIKQRLPPTVTVPPITVTAPPAVARPPAVPFTPERLKEVYVEALTDYGSLLLADDLHVERVDLSRDRSTSTTIEEFPKLRGIALTIFRNTGVFDLYINRKDDYHKLTFNALVYPQTFLLNWFKAKTFYIGNTVQVGAEAVLIAWKRG
jgi:hypothetical protein